jgi:predicted CoA-binding protein
MPLSDDDALRTLLTGVRRIAMVGASAKPDRPSYGVMRFLLDHGWQVIPINPGLVGQSILGQPVVASLSDISPPVDMVDIFRSSDAAGGVVDDAIAHGARAVWLQLGVIDQAAAARAEQAGLAVVMDHCPKIEVRRLGISGPA